MYFLKHSAPRHSTGREAGLRHLQFMCWLSAPVQGAVNSGWVSGLAGYVTLGQHFPFRACFLLQTSQDASCTKRTVWHKESSWAHTASAMCFFHKHSSPLRSENQGLKRTQDSKNIKKLQQFLTFYQCLFFTFASKMCLSEEAADKITILTPSTWELTWGQCSQAYKCHVGHNDWH